MDKILEMLNAKATAAQAVLADVDATDEARVQARADLEGVLAGVAQWKADKAQADEVRNTLIGLPNPAATNPVDEFEDVADAPVKSDRDMVRAALNKVARMGGKAFMDHLRNTGGTQTMRFEKGAKALLTGSESLLSDDVPYGSTMEGFKLARDKRPGLYETLMGNAEFTNAHTISWIEVDDAAELGEDEAEAREVALGERKPAGSIHGAVKSVRLSTVARWMEAAEEDLDDYAGLQQLIEGTLAWNLRTRIAKQFVNGDGEKIVVNGVTTESVNLKGILAYAGQSYTAAEGERAWTSVEEAVLLAQDVGTDPTHIVLNPRDALQFTRVVIVGENGVARPYKTGDDVDGLTVIRDKNVPQGTFVVFTNDRELIRPVIRHDVDVKWALKGDDFIEDKVTARAVARLTLRVTLPNAIVKGTFSDAAYGDPVEAPEVPEVPEDPEVPEGT